MKKNYVVKQNFKHGLGEEAVYHVAGDAFSSEDPKLVASHLEAGLIVSAEKVDADTQASLEKQVEEKKAQLAALEAKIDAAKVKVIVDEKDADDLDEEALEKATAPSNNKKK